MSLEADYDGDEGVLVLGSVGREARCFGIMGTHDETTEAGDGSVSNERLETDYDGDEGVLVLGSISRAARCFGIMGTHDETTEAGDGSVSNGTPPSIKEVGGGRRQAIIFNTTHLPGA